MINNLSKKNCVVSIVGSKLNASITVKLYSLKFTVQLISTVLLFKCIVIKFCFI